MQVCAAIEERSVNLAEFDLLCSPRELELLHKFCAGFSLGTFHIDVQRLGNTVLLSERVSNSAARRYERISAQIRKLKKAFTRPINEADLSFKQIARYDWLCFHHTRERSNIHVIFLYNLLPATHPIIYNQQLRMFQLQVRQPATACALRCRLR